MERQPQNTPPPGGDRWAAQRARQDVQRQRAADEKAALYMALLCSKNVMRSVAARLAAGDLHPAVVKGLVSTLQGEADHAGEVLAENDSLRAPLIRRAA